VASQQPDRGDTRVALAGDWHGNIGWALLMLRVLRKRGVRTIYHLGDFGIWPTQDGDQFVRKVERDAALFGIDIWVTPGNHEDWDRIDALTGAAGEAPAQLTEHIHLLPRGYRWTHAGRTFVSVGGAPSVDYEKRSVGVEVYGKVRGRTWWPNEMITPEVAKSVAAAGHAEILLSHDIPNLYVAAIQQIIVTNRYGWSNAAQNYAAQGRLALDTVWEGVRPRLIAHGHYHVRADTVLDGDAGRVLSVDQEGKPGNLVLLDLSAEDFGVEWLLTYS